MFFIDAPPYFPPFLGLAAPCLYHLHRHLRCSHPGRPTHQVKGGHGVDIQAVLLTRLREDMHIERETVDLELKYSIFLYSLIFIFLVSPLSISRPLGVKCTALGVQCTALGVQCTALGVQCTALIRCTVYCFRCTVYCFRCKLYCFRCTGTAFSVQCTTLDVQCTDLGLQCTALGEQWTALGVHCTALGVRFTGCSCCSRPCSGS